MTTSKNGMPSKNKALPEIVSETEWQAARMQVLEKEKALTHMRDELNAERRRMPMMKIDKAYTLKGEAGEASLLDLFQGRSQLIVYHFMYGPDWKAGCEGCSWVRDAMTHPAHLHARDTSMCIISRTSLENIQQYQKRMSWNTPIPWLSSLGSEFNYDFDGTSEEGEEHGVSMFLRDGDSIYRTYYLGDRGVEYLGTQWSYLDLTVYGRQEEWENSPLGWPQTDAYSWGRRHDEYED